MRFLNSSRRRYRPRLFSWLDADSVGAAIVLIAFTWLCLVGLPIALPNGLADQARDQLQRAGIARGNR